MTGAFEPIARLRIVDCAGEVCAFLAVAYVLVLARSHHDAMVFFGRVGKQLHSTHRNLSQSSHGLLRIRGSLVEEGPNKNPDVSHEHSEARQDKKLGQLSASNVALVRRVDGEFFFPQRFATRASQSTHAFPPTYNPQRSKRSLPAPPGPSCNPWS